MNHNNHIKLKASRIYSVPLKNFEKDFTFIVNGKEYKTTRIIADILSSKICQSHFTDPTNSEYKIETKHNGNFDYFLNLVDFCENDIPIKEIPFISEIIDILDNESIEFVSEYINAKITFENVFDLLKIQDVYDSFNSRQIQKEISFISSHFYEMTRKEEENLKELEIDILIRILENSKLQLKSEDQLLSIINELYLKNPNEYSILYDFVSFSNVSATKIREFLNIFDIEDLTQETWKSLSFRLEQEIIKSEESKMKQQLRYQEKIQGNGIQILYNQKDPFNGIVHFLMKKLKSEVVDITSSTTEIGIDYPENVIEFDKKDVYFSSQDIKNSWICFDFKNHRVLPTHYSLRAPFFGENSDNPRSWVIEGLNEENGESNWEIIDEQRNCPFLNGSNFTHTFKIEKGNNDHYFRKIRMRQTDFNWLNRDFLCINSMEFFGFLI